MRTIKITQSVWLIATQPLKIVNEDVLNRTNDWIPFDEDDLEAYYIEWASPAGYDSVM